MVSLYSMLRLPEAASIEIDLASAIPAYRQIVDQGAPPVGDRSTGARDRSAGRSGGWRPGWVFTTIPWPRPTARLAGEGWLQIAQGKTVRVVERATTPAPARRAREMMADFFGRRLRHLAAEVKARGLSASAIASLLRLLAEEVD